MAELVHFRLEQSLPQLEEMERVGLFTKQEVRQIIKKRERLEYRLRRLKKAKEDYLQYIEFEVNLLMLIRKKRERLLLDTKKKEIDYQITHKIDQLFKTAISKYPEDVKMRLDHIKFCKTMKFHESISGLYSKMLQIHSTIPKLWIMAAKWEMEENHSAENARSLLQRGIVMNPKSERMWREYFRMELLYTDMIRKRKEILNDQRMRDSEPEESDAVLNGQTAIIVYDKAVEEIDDVDFALAFVQICLQFDFTSKHIDHILDDVQARYPDKEEALDAIAKTPLLHVQEKIDKGKEMGMKKKAVLRNLHDEISSKYDEAVQVLPTKKMWSLYLEFLISLLKSVKENKKKKLQDKLLEKMEQAAEIDCLALEYCSYWADLLLARGNKELALSVLLTAARKSKEVSVWLKCLTLHIQCRKSSKDIYLLLTEALSMVEEKDTVPLWKLGVDWLSFCDPEKLIDFFERGIQECKEVSFPLKEMYLEATVLRSGIKASRELYKKFKKMGPISLPLIRKIILIEKGQLKPSEKLIRKYYDDGVREFGTTNVDIWLDYIKWERESSDLVGGDVGLTYWRAMKTLSDDKVKEFQDRMTKSLAGFPVSSPCDPIS